MAVVGGHTSRTSEPWDDHAKRVPGLLLRGSGDNYPHLAGRSCTRSSRSRCRHDAWETWSRCSRTRHSKAKTESTANRYKVITRMRRDIVKPIHIHNGHQHEHSDNESKQSLIARATAGAVEHPSLALTLPLPHPQ